MKKRTAPILVTGSPRSGSTWAGKILAAAPRTAYVHEPFNVGIQIGVSDAAFENWFQYVCEETPDPYRMALDRLVHYKYPFGKNMARVRTVRDAAKMMRDQGRFLLHKLSSHTPIIKDPIAIFSAEWLNQALNMNVLVMIRHPAAFCSSLKIKNWQFDFRFFLNQPLLMEAYLGKFEREIIECKGNAKSLIDRAILLWNCIHHTISIYQESHPEWLFVRHEDLSRDPVGQFQAIYAAFGLEFTDKVKLRILETSGAHNPVEQDARNEFVRDSKRNIYNWKRRLSQSEIDLIKARTCEVSSAFYAESEW